MTYCVAIKVNAGLVFASDTRTNAGVDNIATYKKLYQFEREQCYSLCILTAGNLAVTQGVIYNIQRDIEKNEGLNYFIHLFDIAHYVHELLVKIQKKTLEPWGIPFNSNHNYGASFIIGGQMMGETPSIYLVTSSGVSGLNDPKTKYFQVGETHYGKPILDRMVEPNSSLEEVARCALLSLDSSMRSNLTVGLPIDLCILPKDTLQFSHTIRYHGEDDYFKAMRDTWGISLSNIISELPKFDWEIEQPNKS